MMARVIKEILGDIETPLSWLGLGTGSDPKR